NDLAAVVGAAGGADDVRQFLLTAPAVRALHQGRHGRLPLGTTHAGVGPGHLALGDGHDYFSSSVPPNRSRNAAQRGSMVSWWWSGASSAHLAPHSEHSPRQSGEHSGDEGSAVSTRSRTTGSRSISSSTSGASAP